MARAAPVLVFLPTLSTFGSLQKRVARAGPRLVFLPTLSTFGSLQKRVARTAPILVFLPTLSTFGSLQKRVARAAPILVFLPTLSTFRSLQKSDFFLAHTVYIWLFPEEVARPAICFFLILVTLSASGSPPEGSGQSYTKIYHYACVIYIWLPIKESAQCCTKVDFVHTVSMWLPPEN